MHQKRQAGSLAIFRYSGKLDRRNAAMASTAPTAQPACETNQRNANTAGLCESRQDLVPSAHCSFDI
jgi:hypothetical protein